MKKMLCLALASLLIAVPMWSCGAQKATEEIDPGNGSEIPEEETNLAEGEENPENVEEKFSDINYEEEDDEASITFSKTSLDKYYGDWTAKSGRAEFLYGNVDMTVKSDGTYTANITGENLKGKWTDEGDHIRCHNSLFSFSLAFDKSGKLIFINDENEDDINIVMTRK